MYKMYVAGGNRKAYVTVKNFLPYGLLVYINKG